MQAATAEALRAALETMVEASAAPSVDPWISAAEEVARLAETALQEYDAGK